MGLFGHGDDDKKDEPVVPTDQSAGQAPVDNNAGAPTPAAGGDANAWPAPTGGETPVVPGADQTAGVPTAPAGPAAPADGAGQWSNTGTPGADVDAGMASEPSEPADPTTAPVPGADASAGPAAGAADGSEEGPKVG